MTLIQPLAFLFMPSLGPYAAGPDGPPDTSGFLDLIPPDQEEPALGPDAVPPEVCPPVPATLVPVMCWQTGAIADPPARTILDGIETTPPGAEEPTLLAGEKIARCDVAPAQPVAGLPDIGSADAVRPDPAPPATIVTDTAATDKAVRQPGPFDGAGDQRTIPMPPLVKAAVDEARLPQKGGPLLQGLRPFMTDTTAPDTAATDNAMRQPEQFGGSGDLGVFATPPLAASAADETPQQQKRGLLQGLRSFMTETIAPEVPVLAPPRWDDPPPPSWPKTEAIVLPVMPPGAGPPEEKPGLPPVAKLPDPVVVTDAGQDWVPAKNDVAAAVPKADPAAAEEVPPLPPRAAPAAAIIAAIDPRLPAKAASTVVPAAPTEVQHLVKRGGGPDPRLAPPPPPLLPRQGLALPARPQANPQRQDMPLPHPLQTKPAGQATMPDTPAIPLPEPAPAPVPVVPAAFAMPQQERAGRALWIAEAEPQQSPGWPGQPVSETIDPSISVISEPIPAEPEAKAPAHPSSEMEAHQTTGEPADRAVHLGKADPAPVAAPLPSLALPPAHGPTPDQHAVAVVDWPVAPSPVAPLPDGPPPVRMQIVQALSASGSPVTELRLAPDELGHVRIDMRHEGDRLVMTVSVERPETLDMLRRHAGDLVADLRAGGHAGLDLSFGRWSGPGPDGGRPPAPMDDAGASLSAEALPAAAAEIRSMQPASGLYLRI
ncbi:hypothetical protein MASR1M32_02920 [Rhodobacter sp.]